MIPAVEYRRKRPSLLRQSIGVPHRLIHSVMQVQPLNSFAFDVNPWKAYHIGGAAAATVLLTPATVIAIVPQMTGKLAFTPFALLPLGFSHMPSFLPGRRTRRALKKSESILYGPIVTY